MEAYYMDLVKIELDNISVTFNGFNLIRLVIPRKTQHIALKAVSMQISEGETVAIMGNNGAGKSTLLNFLAGKLRPSTGKALIHGRILHLSGVNPGFDPALSSRQNIQWLAPIYGSQKNLTNKNVERFSEIGEAYDRPVKTLSAGMKGRVGFGFATSLNPDILLIDEVLGVGDPVFKAKAMKRMREMIGRSGIVLLSTHSVGLVKELCSRCIVLNEGSVIHDGGVKAGIQLYLGK
jgi:ABC-type polysaccharide/polyol phosphate transport system ATPase subunit